MRRFRRRDPRKRMLAFACLVLIFLLIVLLIFTCRMAPLVRTVAVNRAKNLATLTINNAAGKVLKEDSVGYDDLMTLDKDASGHITAVKANTIRIDQLKYEITNEVIKELNAMNTSDLGIPIGTIVGGELFTGLGPRINVKIEPVGSAETKIINQFTSSGINQTHQMITLDVKASITVLISTYNVSTNVESNFTLADTVIVGNIPNSYTVVEDGGGKSDSDKLFLYGNEAGSSSN